KTEEEREEVRRGMEAVEARITAEMDPLLAASRMDVDEVVLMGELRAWLETAIELCYQSSGYRRIKNRRIWSLHDLGVIEGCEAAGGEDGPSARAVDEAGVAETDAALPGDTRPPRPAGADEARPIEAEGDFPLIVEGSRLAENDFALRSPTAGVYYARPDPA